MTNSTLLTHHEALQGAVDTFQTVSARYAITKNLKIVDSCLEPYFSVLKELAQEHGVDLSKRISSQEGSEEFMEAVNPLLSEEVNDPEYACIGREVMEKEDQRGSEIPAKTLASLDFMVE